MIRLHEDEPPIDESLVRRLLLRDSPALASAPLREVDGSGSTNRVFRVGDHHAVRLPRQPGGSSGIDSELRWTTLFARSFPVPIPEIAFVGEPGFDYPERWALTSWLPGRTPSRRDDSRLGRQLAALVEALRAMPVPPAAEDDLSLRSYRAGPLRDVDREFRHHLNECRAIPDLGIDLAASEQLWNAAVAIDAPTQAVRWLHGDLLAENLLITDDGQLTAVLDLGGVAVGDPTVDLVVAWDVLGSQAREEFRECLAIDDVTWLRARAWAVLLALMTFPYYGRTMPIRCARRRELALAALEGE